ncbi:alkylhydroperoxidase domain protein [Saxibacter everestensis]|uniref:Alkylhydroperoxidase domain protein n=1 Tax=Saxibacter everestensis TaxID=2909229 RepID=A0ABY8QRH6_9MICO|nr:alkylhydroperoxidase domain protein [Brevibacteriaceae bacterium ZFBP1038]
MTTTADQLISYQELDRPEQFTQANLDWVPWLEPIPEAELTDVHYAALVQRGRAGSPYFRLLVRDPHVLEARTKTDNDIFHNTADGLPRAERELSAAVTSRVNGCVFCASVHARFASSFSKRSADVQRLLEDVDSDIDVRWNAVRTASSALTKTPVEFDGANIDELSEAGLSDLEIVDVINGASFFNWANRLMLSLGEPVNPPE